MKHLVALAAVFGATVAFAASSIPSTPAASAPVVTPVVIKTQPAAKPAAPAASAPVAASSSSAKAVVAKPEVKPAASSPAK